MTTLTYRAKVFEGRWSYAAVVDGLPVMGAGRSHEEAIQNTEHALRAHLGYFLFMGKSFPEPYSGEIRNDDYFAIQIESDSIQLKNPFDNPDNRASRS